MQTDSRSLYQVDSGNLVVLPYLHYDREKFIVRKKRKDSEWDDQSWTKEALKFGHDLVDCFLQIDRDLKKDSEKTPVPSWVQNKTEFMSAKEASLLDTIEKKTKKVAKLEQDISKLQHDLEQEQELKNLLFEQGKSLENAVIKALCLLGYHAENYDDGELELDQVITSPEGHRYIGECEGKDRKDIDIGVLTISPADV